MNKDKRSFSVIMPVCDQAVELEQNLPAFLTQEYEPGYEVIVVDENSTDNTEDVLKLLKQDYPHLYSTFLPKPHMQTLRPSTTYSTTMQPSPWATLRKRVYDCNLSPPLTKLPTASRRQSAS